MTTLATLVIEIVGDISKYVDSLGEAEKNTGSFSDRAVGGLSALGGGIVVGGLAAAGAGMVGLGLAMKDWVGEASAAQGVQAQTNAVIQSTGGISGMTAAAVDKLATSFSEITPFEDDAIASAENMLLTFTNIGKDVFPGATQTVLDMSQALGQDLNSSAMQLGKALNDPIKGVTALQRVGVTFTAEQKKMISEMVKSGDVMGAQKMILAELGKEFGGSAAAAGQTFAGSWTILQNRMGNFQEQLGTALFPALGKFTTILTEIANKPEVQQFLSDLAVGIGEFAMAAAEWLPKIAGWFQQGFTWLMENKGVIAAALAVVGSSIVAFAYTSLAAAIPTVIAFVAASWPVIAVIAGIAAGAYLLYTAWTSNWGGIQEKTQGVIDFIKNVISSGMQFIQDLSGGKLGWLSTLWNNTTNSIRLVVDTWFKNIKLLFSAFQSAFNGDWRGFGEKLREIWDNTWSMLGTLAKTGFDNFVTMVGGLVTSVIEIFKTTDWGEVGKNIIEGIANGIAFATQWLIDANLNTLKAVLDAIKGFLGIASPSMVMKTEVGWQMGAGVMSGWDESMTEMERKMPVSFSSLVPVAANSANNFNGGRLNNRAAPTQSGQPINVYYTNNSMLSVSDEKEMSKRLGPIIANIVGVEVERKLARRGI